MTATMGRAAGLPSPFFRHALVLLLGVVAVLAPAFVLGTAAEAAQVAWIGAAVVCGLLGGLVGRGWLGLIFLVAGVGLGIGLLLAARFGFVAEAQEHMAQLGLGYLVLLLAALAGYVLVTTALALARRR